METRSITMQRTIVMLSVDMAEMREKLHVQHKTFLAIYVVLEEQEKKINQLRDELMETGRLVGILQDTVDHLKDDIAKKEMIRMGDDAAMFNRVQAISQDVAVLEASKKKEEVSFVR